MKGGVLVEVFMVVLAVLSIVLIVAEYIVPFTVEQLNLIYMVDLVVCLVFAVDFAYRIFKAENRIGFLRSYWFKVLAMLLATCLVYLKQKFSLGQ